MGRGVQQGRRAFVDAEGAPVPQSDRGAAVTQHARSHARSLEGVMAGCRSVGEKKNNELMMTHTRHMLLAGSRTHARTRNS